MYHCQGVKSEEHSAWLWLSRLLCGPVEDIGLCTAGLGKSVVDLELVPDVVRGMLSDLYTFWCNNKQVKSHKLVSYRLQSHIRTIYILIQPELIHACFVCAMKTLRLCTNCTISAYSGSLQKQGPPVFVCA